jgi:GMP synthase (glutamine-hydrolysing)
MTRPRIALLNASDGDHTSRNFRRELDAEVVEFDCSAGRLPETVDFDGGVVTGSRASVYWDERWIADLKTYVGNAVAADLPLLGVCYGHQLLADVMGGLVEPMNEYEIGYREVQHDGGVLLEGIDPEFTVFTTHSDRVTRLPPGADLIAANEYGIHGFRKDSVFAVQFHPEYDIETATRVTNGKETLSDEKLARALNSITEGNAAAARDAKQLFDNFVEYVRESEPAKESTAGTADD